MKKRGKKGKTFDEKNSSKITFFFQKLNYHSHCCHRRPTAPGCKFRCHRWTGDPYKFHFVALRKSHFPGCLIRRGTCKTLVLVQGLLLIRQGKDKQICRRVGERKCVNRYGMSSCFDRDDEGLKKLWRPCRLWCWSLWTPNLCLKLFIIFLKYNS